MPLVDAGWPPSSGAPGGSGARADVVAVILGLFLDRERLPDRY